MAWMFLLGSLKMKEGETRITHTRTHTHTHTHAHTHTHTQHTHTHTHTLTHTRARAHARTHTRTRHTHSLAYSHCPVLLWQNSLDFGILAIRDAEPCLVRVRGVASDGLGWDASVVVGVAGVSQTVFTTNAAPLRPPKTRLPSTALGANIGVRPRCTHGPEARRAAGSNA
jgi:hypothetical protein